MSAPLVPQKLASKQWVVPPRSKPGRKATAPAPSSSAPVAGPSAAVTVKTAPATAPRPTAREKRQEYVAELEAKVRALEQGDGERSVLYQKAAQKLQSENTALKSQIEDLRRQLELASSASAASTSYAPSSLVIGVKRPSSVTSASTASSTAKRPRLSRAGSSASAKPTVAFAPIPVPPPRPDSPSDDSDDEHLWTYSEPLPMTPSLSYGPSGIVPCGLCVSAADGDCMCASLLKHEPAPSPVMPTQAEVAAVTTLMTGAVPLRRAKLASPSKAAKVWDFDRAPEPVAATGPLAMCSGDPRTCPACSDDAFGKAFCTALSDTVCATNPCPGCPGPASCSRGMPIAATSSARDDPHPLDTPEATTVPCSEAWRQLKAHPNIVDADLRMLADVVARQTHCAPPADGSCSSSSRRLTVEKAGLREALDLLDRGISKGVPMLPPPQ